MLTIRRSQDRGHADHGWLDSHHTFSFADYHDPRQMGFRALRVINEDRVEAGQGFGTHGHRDMEIVSYVLEGALAHQDSLGTGSVLRYGDVQRMTAGTGVRHSEFNGSRDQRLHFLQIWILPEKNGLAPGYEEKHFAPADKQGRLRVIASRDAREGSVTIHQDAAIYAGLFGGGELATHALAPGRHAWVHVATGEAEVNGRLLLAGDAVTLSDEAAVEIKGTRGGEVLVFDLA